MRPAFRRGWAGEGETGIDALARASGHRPPHGGVYFRFREREGKAPGVPIRTNEGGDQPPIAAARRTDRHPCPARRRRTPCARAWGPAGVRQGERQACQRVSPNTPRPQERKARDRARQYPFPHSLPAPDRHPDGPRPQARSAPADRAGRPQGSADDDVFTRFGMRPPNRQRTT